MAKVVLQRHGESDLAARTVVEYLLSVINNSGKYS